MEGRQPVTDCSIAEPGVLAGRLSGFILVIPHILVTCWL